VSEVLADDEGATPLGPDVSALLDELLLRSVDVDPEALQELVAFARS